MKNKLQPEFKKYLAVWVEEILDVLDQGSVDGYYQSPSMHYFNDLNSDSGEEQLIKILNLFYKLEKHMNKEFGERYYRD